MSYRHLTIHERYQINAYKQAGYKNYEIAKKINLHPSTIGRELKINSGKVFGIYFPVGADNHAHDRRKERKRGSIIVFSKR